MLVRIARSIQDEFHPGEWLRVKQKEQFAWFVLRPTFRKQNKMYTGGISCKSDSLCSVAEFRSVSTAAAPSSTADKKGRRTKSSVYIKRRFLSNANIASPSYSKLVAVAASFFIKLEKNKLHPKLAPRRAEKFLVHSHRSGSIYIYSCAERVYYLRAALARINSYARHREWKMKRLFWNVLLATEPICISSCSRYCFVSRICVYLHMRASHFILLHHCDICIGTIAWD